MFFVWICDLLYMWANGLLRLAERIVPRILMEVL